MTKTKSAQDSRLSKLVVKVWAIYRMEERSWIAPRLGRKYSLFLSRMLVRVLLGVSMRIIGVCE